MNRLKQLLGEDIDQLLPDEFKQRIGEKLKDFNPKKIPSPLNNEVYSDVVDAKAGDYYNSRVDKIANADIEDNYKNLSNPELVDALSKKYNIKNKPKYEENSNLIGGNNRTLDGGFDPEKNTLYVNKDKSLENKRATIGHEMRHVIDNNSGSIPITDLINKSTLPKEIGLDGPSIKSMQENTYNTPAGDVEQALLDNNFNKVSDYYNRGHFFGNDQVEQIAQDNYNPSAFTKLKNKIKGK